MAAKVATVGLVIFVAHFLVLVFRKTRIPDVLLLMLGGIVIGPVLHRVTPEQFGVMGQIAPTLALVVILFESGINLELRSLFRALGQTLLITLTTALLTGAVVTAVMVRFTPVGLPLAMLTGAVLAGTSSAVVIPLVEALVLGESPRTVLFLESAITDVLCIVCAVVLLDGGNTHGVDLGRIARQIALSFGVALAIGAAAGLVWSTIMGQIRKFPNTIFTTVAYVLIVYGLTELWGFSGAIAALALGVTLANAGGLRVSIGAIAFELKKPREQDKLFFSEAVFLLKTFFFLYLGISLKFSSIIFLYLALAILVPVYIGRFLIVRLLASRSYTRRDVSLMTVMVPKGLAAAVLATLPVQHQLPHAEWVPNTVYMVVLTSISMTAVLVMLLEKSPLKKAYCVAFKSFLPDEPLQATHHTSASVEQNGAPIHTDTTDVTPNA
jgi:NhaP-type Na+/H+ or K+/H+ antiporter